MRKIKSKIGRERGRGERDIVKKGKRTKEEQGRKREIGWRRNRYSCRNCLLSLDEYFP